MAESFQEIKKKIQEERDENKNPSNFLLKSTATAMENPVAPLVTVNYSHDQLVKFILQITDLDIIWV